MFNLSQLPRPLPKYEAEEIAMGNINYSDLKKGGDMAESFGISARRYPYISTRKAWTQLVPSGGTTAIFIWNGHKIRVTDGILYYDESPLDNVTPGEKQFAVINTKLVIWPDKSFIDLQNGKFGKLNATVTIPSADIKNNSITGAASSVVSSNVVPRIWRGYTWDFQPVVFTYGKDPQGIDWSSENGWSLPTAQLATIWGDTKYSPYNVLPLEVGDIVILKKVNNSYDFVWIDKKRPNQQPDTSEYNNEGYYGVITSLSGSRSPYKPNQRYQSSWSVAMEVHKTGGENVDFEKNFSKGETVQVSGTLGGLNDMDKASIKEVNAETNTLKFADKTFKEPIAYRYENTPTSIGEYSYILPSAVVSGNRYYVVFTATESIPKDSYVFVFKDSEETAHVSIWNPKTKREEQRYSARLAINSSGGSGGATLYVMKNENVKISKSIPDMDFICEKDNRLWGCSSKEHTIYASALGLPDQFFTYAGTATDSYAVPVGSDGDFTACHKFGDSVLFFKENEIIKIPGGYPAAYALYSYTAEGVKTGCHKSLQILNNILYYLGPHGVYAYNGGTPYLISPNFGAKDFTVATSGNDGDTYYLSCMDGEIKHLFAYETRYGVWVREASEKALDFSRDGRELIMLKDDGEIVNISKDVDDKNLNWMARFVPQYETIKGRKTHSKLIIRAEVPQGSFLLAEIRSDGGVWKQAGKIVGSQERATSLTLPLNRADKFELRISGRGPCTVLSILREFTVHGTR